MLFRIVSIMLVVPFIALFAQWEIIEIPGNTQAVTRMKLIDENNYMGISYGRYFNTTNNGDTWNLALLNGHAVSGVEARDSDTIFICGNIPLEKKGFFYSSFDNGATWAQYKFDSTTIPASLIADISFKDSETIFVCGDYNIILKTTNNGRDWVSCYVDEVEKNFRSISFGDESTGYVLGSYRNGIGINRIVYKSSDSGNTWDSIAVFHDANFRRLQAVSKDIVYIAGQDSVYEAVYKTTDGGKTWSKVWKGLMRNSGLWSMYFVDENLGYIGAEEGAVYKTKNGGESWSAMPNGSGASVLNISFLNEYFGFSSAGNQLFKWDNIGKKPIIETASKLSFEETELGDSLIKELEIVNMGDLNLEISNISFNGNGDSLFSYNAELPMSIIPWGIETIPVKFKPKSKGVFNAGLVIESNAGNSPYHEVLLEGIGEEPVSVESIFQDCKFRFLPGKGIYLSDCSTSESNIMFDIYDIRGKLLLSGQSRQGFVDLSFIQPHYSPFIFVLKAERVQKSFLLFP